jgi:hypothetical protein
VKGKGLVAIGGYDRMSLAGDKRIFIVVNLVGKRLFSKQNFIISAC